MGWRWIESQEDYWPGDIALTIANVVGSPGSGKTTFIKTMISRTLDHIPRDETYYIRSREVRDVYQEINPDKKYHIFFIEDAGKEQTSRRSMSDSNVELVKNLPDVRHIAKKLHGLQEGRIIIYLASHFPAHIDKVIRGFEQVRFYKDMNLTEDEYKRVLETLDLNYHEKREIQNWVRRVLYDEPEAMSKVLTVMRSGDWDFLNFEPDGEDLEPDLDLVEYEIPDQSSSSKSKDEDPSIDYEADDLEELISKELDNMTREDSYSKYARVLKKQREGLTNIEIAEELEDVSEGSISHHKKKAIGELKRRIGLAYEEIVADQLKEKGWSDIERRGGTGEPDIIASNPDDIPVAVSVKLYSYGRPRHSLELEEMRPELNYADDNDEAEAWLWYTNLDWGGSAGKTYFDEIPTALDRIIIKKDEGILEPD